MSIFDLVEENQRRRTLNKATTPYRAQAAQGPDEPKPPGSGKPAEQPPPGGGAGGAESALRSLSKFLPVETITFYLLGLSIFAASTEAESDISTILFWIYIICLLLTPVFVMLAQAVVRAKQHERGFALFWPAPWWALAAATSAFAVWGLAIPGSFIERGSIWQPVVACSAIGVSLILDQVERIIHPA